MGRDRRRPVGRDYMRSDVQSVVGRDYMRDDSDASPAPPPGEPGAPGAPSADGDEQRDAEPPPPGHPAIGGAAGGTVTAPRRPRPQLTRPTRANGGVPAGAASLLGAGGGGRGGNGALTTAAPPPEPTAQPDAGREPGRMAQAVMALGLRDFRLLFVSTVSMGFGQWAQMIGMGWLVFVLSGGSAAQLGLVSAAGGLVRLVVAPMTGVALDRWNRRSIMVVTTAAGAVQGAALGVLVLSGTVEIWHVYAFTLLEGALTTVNQTARQAFVYDISTDEAMPNAVALNSIAQNLARIVGPPMTGAMIGFLGTASPFLFIMVVQSIAVVLTLQISRTTRQAAPSDAESPLRSLMEGMRYVVSDRRMLGLMLTGVIPAVFVYPYIPFLPVFAEEVLNAGATGYGTLAASLGWGSLAGLIVLALLGRVRRKGAVALWGLVGYAVLLLGFSQSNSFWLAAALLAGAGVFHGVALTMSQTLVQLFARNEMRGRATAAFQTGFALMPLGALPLGFAVDAYGAQAAVGVSFAISIVLLTLMSLFWSSLVRAET